MILRTVVSARDLPEIEAFEAQVEACQEFLNIHLEFQKRDSTFFMDHALIPALFFSATRCLISEYPKELFDCYGTLAGKKAFGLRVKRQRRLKRS